MNFKKYKWVFYIFTFLLITVVATVLSAMKSGDNIPDFSNAILLIGTVYVVLILLYRLFKLFRDKREEKKIIKMASEIFDDNQNTSKTKQSLFKRKIIIRSFLIIAGIFLVFVLFYWFQLRPNSIRESCLGEVTKNFDIKSEDTISSRLGNIANNSYRLCLAEHGLKPESLFEETKIEPAANEPDASQIEGSIDDLKSSLQNSLEEQKQQIQDEFNNQANCQSNGGRYQGNGLCVYY